MRCPLSQMTTYPELRETRFRWEDCLKEECTWWGKLYGRCDPTGTTPALEGLTAQLAELVRIFGRTVKT